MLKWTFGADTKPFQAGLAEMRTQTQAFSKSLGGMFAGAIGVGALIAGAKSFIEEMARIDDLSKRFGESAETIQRVGNAAELAGADLETVAKAMTKVTQNAVAAAGGGKKMGEAFAALGIDAAAFADMSMDQKMIALSAAFVDSGSQANGLAAMMEVLGKSAAELIPLLAEGPEGLKKVFKESDVVAQSAVNSMAKVDDAMAASSQWAKKFTGQAIQGFQALWIMMKHVGETHDIFDKDFSIFKPRVMGGDELAELEESLMPELAPPKKPKTGAPDPEADKELLEDKKKLAEEIAELEEEARQRQLSLDQKILEARQKLFDIASTPRTPGELGTMEMDRDKLETQAKLNDLLEEQSQEQIKAAKELDGIKKKAQDKIDKEADEKKDKQERVEGLLDEEEQVERDGAFDALKTNEDKIKFLEREKAGLLEKADEALFAGDEEGEIEARTEAKRKQIEINGIKKEDSEKTATPTIAAEDLRRAGGGGFARLTTSDPQREALTRFDTMILELREINRKTNGGESTVPPPF